MMFNKPFKTGVGNVKRLYGDEAGGPPLQKLKSGATLKELQEDYVFFNYAPLFLYGKLQHNPVQEWINENNHAQIVFIISLDIPILSLADTQTKFDSILWCVEKQYWSSLSFYISSMSFIDRQNKALYSVVCQELPILDVRAINKVFDQNNIPTINIYTFSVDSNKFCLPFKPTTNFLIDKPKLIMIQARNETIKLANALFAFNSMPYETIQNPPWSNIDGN